MQANIIKREILQRKTIYDGAVELGVQSDIVLPDYCGDIERILKCTFVPRVSSKIVEGTRLSVSGIGFLRMVYKTADGRVESFETQAPFSKNIDMPSEGKNAAITVDLCTEFCSCRAISPRRFEMSATLQIKAKVCTAEKIPLALDAEEGNIEIKKKEMEVTLPVAFACENFTVMEEYDLAGEPIKSVVRMTANPSVSEYKIVSGKIILKGSVDFCAVYLTEGSDTLQKVNYSIPVNHIMSVDGAEETDSAQLHLSICRMSAEGAMRGDRGELIVEIFLEVCADISRKESVEVAIDAYCVGFESKCQYQNVSLCVFEDAVEKTHTMSVPFEIENGEMIDCFAEVKNTSARVNEHGEIVLSADGIVTALIKGEDGEPFSREKTAPIEFSLAVKPEFADASLDANLAVASVNAAQNKAVQISLVGKCRIVKKQSLPLVSEVEVMSDSPRMRDAKTALTIYFAQKGEDTFDIAKRYNTSALAVSEQNALSDTVIPNDMTILIPMTR